MVFDASSWSLTHTCQVGNARLVKKTHAAHTNAPIQLHVKTQMQINAQKCNMQDTQKDREDSRYGVVYKLG